MLRFRVGDELQLTIHDGLSLEIHCAGDVCGSGIFSASGKQARRKTDQTQNRAEASISGSH
jgi:hypothetical protein